MDQERIFPTIGVAGASGSVGRMVVERLVRIASEGSATAVVRLSRRNTTSVLPPDVSAWHAAGHSPYRCMDYGDPESLRAAFRGLDVLVFPGSDGDPAQMLAHHQNVVQAAVEARVGSLVYLSTLGAAQDSPFPYARIHGATEELLRQTVVNAARQHALHVHLLRASIFTEFFLEAFVAPALPAGVLRLPVSSGRVSFVSKVDVARALAGAALLPRDPIVHIYVWEITGPAAVSMHELCGMFEAGADARPQFAEISETGYREQLHRRGYESWLIEAFATMLSISIPGRYFELVSADVEKLSGVGSCAVADVVATWTAA